MSRALTVVLTALLFAGAAVAPQGSDVPVEPLPADQEFHPAYTLQQDAIGTPEPEQAATVSRAEEDLPVEPLPPDDPVAQGFEQPTWVGDIEDTSLAWTRPDLALLRIEPDLLGEPRIVFISPQPEEEWIEGAPVTLRWLASRPIAQVRIYYYYDRCKLAGRSRGRFGALVTPMTPNERQFRWAVVPWMDSPAFRIRIAGYDADSNLLASDEIGVRFRPKELANIPSTCIAIIKRKQRLYCYVEGRVKRMHLVSTGRGWYCTPNMRPGSYDRRRGAMGKVFRKDPCAWSRAYHCPMPYWLQITSTGSHGIHATSPRFYRRLGGPASHGCVRQHRADAKVLYQMVPVGMPVYIF